ncbi:MAG: hypothetical protein QME66_13310, partial [Candidatus Eisenbacteria bacterium]|nr:hypothetical protein [Candidatus Eisenbacteria bacterium]
MKQMVLSSLEPWMCHDCGDCSTVCPRETKPRDGMVTLRRYLASHYDWTGITAKINSSKTWYIGSLSFVAALVLFLVVAYHVYAVKMPFPDFALTPMPLEHMFPMMTHFTLVVILLPLFFLFSFAMRMYWFTMRGTEKITVAPNLYFMEGKTFLYHLTTHKKMGECPEKSRWPKHLVLAWGVMIKLSLLVFALAWFQTDKLYRISHPQRWIGYLVTAFIIYGTADILASRLRKEKEVHKFSDMRDWAFPILLLAAAISGIIVHIVRYAGLEFATHYAYIFHIMVSVPLLVIEMPFGKWTHMIYRPMALYFQSLKEKAMQKQ